jgi:hypothetical protein
MTIKEAAKELGAAQRDPGPTEKGVDSLSGCHGCLGSFRLPMLSSVCRDICDVQSSGVFAHVHSVSDPLIGGAWLSVKLFTFQVSLAARLVRVDKSTIALRCGDGSELSSRDGRDEDGREGARTLHSK